MTQVDTANIYDSVVAMLRVNMGLQPTEKVLVLTDTPSAEDWQDKETRWLSAAISRCVLARQIVDIVRQQFPGCPVEFLPFPATGSHGAEPDPFVADRMSTADVIIAPTTYSMSHTNARVSATSAGGRVASMPEFEARMLEQDGPMNVDYQQIASDCLLFAHRLTAASRVLVRSPQGTELSFGLAGRAGQVDTGLYNQPGQWGNLPAGEAYAVPAEGTGQGQLVAPAGWYPYLNEDLIFQFIDGQVVDIQGGGSVGDNFRRLLDVGNDTLPFVARRNLAELGIGTNPQARKPDNVLEAEKIRGTVHIAIGDNFHMGGTVESDLHDDFVLPTPDLILDDIPVILGGQWQL